MSPKEKDQAERMRRNAHISYAEAAHILSAANQNNYRQLAIHIEKYLMTGDQVETLKELGLTVLDVLVGNYEWYDIHEIERLVYEWNNQLGEQVIKLVPVCA